MSDRVPTVPSYEPPRLTELGTVSGLLQGQASPAPGAVASGPR